VSDPATCPACKGPMKPLFTGFYCPKDCDRPFMRKEQIDKEIKQAQDAMAKPQHWTTLPTPMFIPYRGANYTPPMADDECRDFYCNGKGKPTHTAAVQNPGGPLNFVYYQCGLCNKTWSVNV
jgi:hypothetical protein